MGLTKAEVLERLRRLKRGECRLSVCGAIYKAIALVEQLDDAHELRNQLQVLACERDLARQEAAALRDRVAELRAAAELQGKPARRKCPHVAPIPGKIASREWRLLIEKKIKRIVKAELPDEFFDVGTSPQPAMYPCDSLSVGVQLHLRFPPGVSNEIRDESATMLELEPYLAGIGLRVAACLERAGCCECKPTQKNFTFVLPPCSYFSTDAEREFALRHGRWMTEREVTEYVAKYDQEPFTDEAWINTHWAGIRVSFTAKYIPEIERATAASNEATNGQRSEVALPGVREAG